MKSARWLILSLALNLGLGASLLWLARGAPLASSHLSSREITNRNIRVAARSPMAGDGAGTQTVQVNEPFHWSQLESEDYRVYTANLRGIGCPEATVRDIIVADVRELFQRRLRELVEPVVSRFWELIGNKEQMEAMVKEKEQQLDSLEAERRSLLEEVLGQGLADHDPTAERARVERREARRAALSFLPEEKVARCLELEEKFAQLREAANRQPRGTPQEQQAELKRLHEEEQAELSRALSSEELAEYKLRNSRFVDSVLGLPGFEAGEDELKEIVRLKEELARTAELKERNVDLRITQRAQAEKKMQESLKNRLGPERFAEYQRAQDGRYQEIYQLVSRFDLPQLIAADVYEMQREAEAHAGRLAADKTITDEQRQELLQAIRIETGRSIAGALGSKPFEVYQSRYGKWLADMGPKAATPK
jgi:hypothetical protein